MGLNISEWFSHFGRRVKHTKKCRIPLSGYADELTKSIQIREAAFHACTNLIANCISKCELRTYKNGILTKDAEWYRWNIQPNLNQNATAFWQKLIHRLYEDNEALVVARSDGSLYVADRFVRDDSQAFSAHKYREIQIDDLIYSAVLDESMIFYFALHDVNVKDLVDEVTGMYGKLISAFISAYTEAKGTKGVLYIDQIAEQEEDFESHLDELVGEDFKNFYQSSSAVMPLFNGYKYEELSKKTAPDIETRDLNNQIKDIFELYAVSFGIPKSLITGEVQDTSTAVDNLLTFVLEPVLALIEDELNRKLFTREQFLKGSHVEWQTNAIRHIDIIDVATNVEKLISSGFCSIDDIREICGMDRLNEEFSSKYFMTKNFSTVDELLKSIERSDGNEKQRDDQNTEGSVSTDQESAEKSDSTGSI